MVCYLSDDLMYCLLMESFISTMKQFYYKKALLPLLFSFPLFTTNVTCHYCCYCCHCYQVYYTLKKQHAPKLVNIYWAHHKLLYYCGAKSNDCQLIIVIDVVWFLTLLEEQAIHEMENMKFNLQCLSSGCSANGYSDDGIELDLGHTPSDW